jgi:CBS domain-containing protein
MRVRDAMTYGAIGVPETATLAEAVETLLRSRVSALLVFDPKHRLVGVLSEGDLLRRAELGTDNRRPQWLEFLLNGGRLADAYTRTHGRVVGEIMTTSVKTISEVADLREAVDLMLRANVKRLPVLRGGAVVGVISRSDLLWLLTSLPKPGSSHPDAEIRSAIQGELDKLSWTPRATIRADVAGGVVTFEGAITDERLHSALKMIAENTPGVVAVRDHLAWIEPNSGEYLPQEMRKPFP